MIKAKFKVSSVQYTEGSRVVLDPQTGKPKKDAKGYDVYAPCTLATIVMNPVYGNGDPHHENTKFWQATPSGKLEFMCVNEEATKQLQLGKEYILTMELAE